MYIVTRGKMLEFVGLILEIICLVLYITIIIGIDTLL